MKKPLAKKPKKIISLLEFIKTGSFGGARLNMTPKEVISHLGKPTHDHGTPDCILLGYGCWEVHFMKTKGDSAFLIYNDHLLNDCVNHDEMLELESEVAELNLDFIKPFKHVRLHQVTALLDQEKIPYRLVNKPYQPLIQTESDVYLDFTDIEPVSPKGEGVFWGPGRGDDLQEGEKRITKSEDLILYTIGAHRY